MADSAQSKSLVQRRGEARLEIWAAIAELREAVQIAELLAAPGHVTAIRLNDLSRRVSVAVRDFGSLL